MAPADIAAYLIYPGMEACRRREPVQMAPAFEQGLLDHIVDVGGFYSTGVCYTTKPPQRRREQAILIGKKSFAEPLIFTRKLLPLCNRNKLALHIAPFVATSILSPEPAGTYAFFGRSVLPKKL